MATLGGADPLADALAKLDAALAAADSERAEIAKFVGWYGRKLRVEGAPTLTTHDLSIMIARGDRAPADACAIDPKWPVRGEKPGGKRS